MVVVTVLDPRVSWLCEEEMPHTIKCPNCKAPIHLKANQSSAVCDYCGHQARQTVMAQPKPPQRTPPRPQLHQAQRQQIQAQMQRAQKKTKKTILIIVLTSTLFPLLLSVCIPVIVCNTRVKHSQRQLGVSSLDSSADQKLALAIGANVRCINSFLYGSSYAQERYFGWVDREAGPNCKSNRASYGIHKASYNVATCQKALQEAGAASPPLQRHGQALVAAAATLKKLTNQAYKYYHQKDYLDDDCAEGKRLHQPLVASFDAYNKAERAIRAVIEKQLPPLIKRRRDNARQSGDLMGTMMANYYQVWIDMRALVNACDQLAGDRGRGGDAKAVRALIAKVDQASADTVSTEKKLQPRTNNWIKYFLFPFTYESHLNGYAEQLVKSAKEHVRCVEGKQRCEFTGTLNAIYDAYNSYVGYAKGLGPKLHKIAK